MYIYIDQARHGKFSFVKANYDGWPPHLAAGFSFCHELTVLFEKELKATYVYIVKVLPDPGVPLVAAFFRLGVNGRSKALSRPLWKAKQIISLLKRKGIPALSLSAIVVRLKRIIKAFKSVLHWYKTFGQAYNLHFHPIWCDNVARFFNSITQLVNVLRMSGKSRFLLLFSIGRRTTWSPPSSSSSSRSSSSSVSTSPFSADWGTGRSRSTLKTTGGTCTTIPP